MTRPKQPDRFERMVCAVQRDSTVEQISRVEAMKLLRREHAWMVRMIKRMLKEERASGTMFAGPGLMLEEIIRKLEQRRRK